MGKVAGRSAKYVAEGALTGAKVYTAWQVFAQTLLHYGEDIVEELKIKNVFVKTAVLETIYGIGALSEDKFIKAIKFIN
jgi:hypothetical protein